MKTLDISEQEYFTWCLGKLSPTEFIVYKACEFIGEEARTSMADIGGFCNLHEDTVRQHMRRLQRERFLFYHSTGGEMGTTILWLRKGMAEQPPQKGNLLKKMAITLWGPDKKAVQIVPGHGGGIIGFCERHGLNRTNVYRLLSGELKTYKGWTA